MIEHLRGREQALESLGWTGREAEWIALVCLHKIGLPDIKQILGPPVEAQRVTPLDRRSPVKQCLNETGGPVAPGIKIETPAPAVSVGPVSTNCARVKTPLAPLSPRASWLCDRIGPRRQGLKRFWRRFAPWTRLLGFRIRQQCRAPSPDQDPRCGIYEGKLCRGVKGPLRRFAPGLRADPKDALLYEGKGGFGPWGARAGR